MRKYCTVTVCQLIYANTSVKKLTGNQTRLEGRFKEAKQESNGKDGRDRERECDTKDQGTPDDHAAAEDLGDGEFAYTLVHEGFTDNDADPQHSTGQGIVLADRFDIGLPAFMSVESMKVRRRRGDVPMMALLLRVPADQYKNFFYCKRPTLVEGLGDIGDTHDRDEAAH